MTTDRFFHGLLIVVAIGLPFFMVRYNIESKQQQRQLDQLSLMVVNSVRDEAGTEEGVAVIQSGTCYKLLFADFERGRAILKATRNGKTHKVIAEGVSPEVLADWVKNLHFKG